MEVNHIPLDKIYHKIPSLANGPGANEFRTT